jgi:mannose/fructose/N-acetylgalactosamine-specific phosphotransferase system component IIB
MQPMEPTRIFRVDDRLIHGQVCVGWAEMLEIPLLVLADDEIATSSFEQDLYCCCPSPDQRLEFVSLDEMAENTHTPPTSSCLVVLASVESLYKLVQAGARLDSVTLGGLHDQDGATCFRDALFLTEGQQTLLRLLMAEGLNISFQPLPGNSPEDLATLLK